MPDTPWILLLFSLPSSSGTARVGIWRKLKKSGALPLKTSAYLMPNRPEMAERFQWLAQQVKDAGGEATLVFASELEGMTHDEIVHQFHEARATDYAGLSSTLNDLIASQRKKTDETLAPELEKVRRQFEEIRRIDFFECPAGDNVAMLIERAASLPDRRSRGKQAGVLNVKRFSGKTWLTRPRPAIDRVGSAWLIRHHIDPKARFVFANKPEDYPDAIPYDMTGVEFTHHGDDCTFENLLTRFDIKDKILRRIGEMIHDADLEDAKFQTIEAFGMDRVFKGWARLGVTDEEIFLRGFPCFDALYAFLKSKS